MARTKLVEANQVRWCKVGQLTRTAALLNSLLHSFPNLRVDGSVEAAIGTIKAEADYLNKDYAAFKLNFKQQQERKRLQDETNRL